MWNAAYVARACRICLAGFALVILPASLAQADYGPRSRIGANYQQTSNTVSIDGFNEGQLGDCNGQNFCYIMFQRAPQQKALIVQHLSCRTGITAGEISDIYLLTRKGQTFPHKVTHLVAVNTAGTAWFANGPVVHLLELGERPIVRFNTAQGQTTNWGFTECTIAGKLQQP